MKRVLLATLVLGAMLSGDVLLHQVWSQPGVQQTAQAPAPAELRIPARKQQAPVPALLQSRANEIYNTTCAACHGTSNQPGPSARALFSTDFLNSRTDAQIVQVLTDGLTATPNHSFK